MRIRSALKQFQTQGVKNSLTLTTGNLASSIIAALTFIVTSRHLSPIEFGTFSTLLALLLLFTRLNDFGLNIAIQRQIAKESSTLTVTQIIKTALFLKLISWLALFLIGLLASPFLTQLIIKNIPSQTLTQIFALVIITLIYDILMVIIQGLQKFHLTSFYNILLSSLKFISVLILIFTARATGQTVFYLFAIIPLVPSLFIFTSLPLKALYNFDDFRTQTHKVFKVAKWTGLAVVAAAAADNLDIILIQTFLNPYQTGLYAAASRLSIFFSLIGMSIGTVLNIQVAKYKSVNQVSIYLTKAKLFAVLSFLGLTLVSLFSYWGIYFTAGSEYVSASLALTILLIATGIDIATSPFIALFYLYDYPRYYFYAGGLLLITLITSNLIFIPQFGITGAALAKLLTRTAIFIFTIYYAHRATRAHLKSL